MKREDVTALVEALETCLEMEERPKVIELARAALAAAKRSTEDGCHCGTCTCNPNMTPAVRFDLSPAQMEGAIRDHLIRLGWTPPDEHAQSQPAEQPAEPVKAPSYDLAHEIWAAAQLAPGEGIEDAVERVAALLAPPQAEVEALRREVEECSSFAEAQVELRDEAESCAEELAKALAELITWIPSADTYRRLGFDPEAPMRALKRAKLSLGSIGGLSNE